MYFFLRLRGNAHRHAIQAVLTHFRFEGSSALPSSLRRALARLLPEALCDFEAGLV